VNIEVISESAWTSVIEGTRNIQFEFLALQLFLVSLRKRLRAREITTRDCIRELKTFYVKFSRLPMAEQDFNKIANIEETPTSRLLDPAETARRILAGESLMLAGEEALLAALPPGNWIGGTIPYFMTLDGGCLCKDKIFVTDIPGEFHASIRRYGASDLPGIYRDAGEGAVSFVILPADSPAHTEFALRAPSYTSFALHPTVGWVAGIDLARLGKATPKVFCGGPEPLADAAVVMRLKLPADHLAQVKTINLFQPGDGDAISFPASGFSATTAMINGRTRNLAEYLQSIQADTRLPLVANYFGAMVNVSIKNLDTKGRRIDFYAPVVAGVEYKLASPVRDYVAEFEARLGGIAPSNVLFSCNCILNYLHSKLEGHRVGALVGPVTFGEIAFQLLNQTLVYLEVVKVASSPPASTVTPLELAAAHEELQASERRFRALSDFAPMGIFLTGADGRLVYENSRCQELSGFSTEDAIAGRSWLQNIHPNDLPGVKTALKESQHKCLEFDHEFRFVRADGDIRWVRCRTAFLRSDTGEITGRIGMMADVSDRKRAEIELERISQDLLSASREAAIAEFASGVLHNVKNVINSINTSAGVIADRLQRSKSSHLTKVTALLGEHAGDLGSFITEHPQGKLVPGYLAQLAEHLAAERQTVLGELRELEQNVRHVKEIVTMQQNSAKSGGTSEKARPIDLMEDSLRIVSSSLARHGVQVVRDYAGNLPDITVEKHKVLQVLVNLLRNANQACQASDRSDKQVALRAGNGGEFIRLTVADNGVGIPPENLSRMFEHGFTTKKDGHGFGLRSSARIVRELGGDLQAHSDGVGAGASFLLTLPIRPPAAP
jgi:PAS domain S-box-containing protein